MLEELTSVDLIGCWGTLLDTEERVIAALERLEYDPDLYLIGGDVFRMPEGYDDIELVQCGGILNTPLIVAAIAGTVKVTKIYRPKLIPSKVLETTKKRESIHAFAEHLGIDTKFAVGMLIFGRQW